MNMYTWLPIFLITHEGWIFPGYPRVVMMCFPWFLLVIVRISIAGSYGSARETRHLWQSGTWLMTHCMVDTPQHPILEMISTTQISLCLGKWHVAGAWLQRDLAAASRSHSTGKSGDDITSSTLTSSRNEHWEESWMVEPGRSDWRLWQEGWTTAVTTARHKKGDDWLVVSNIFHFP